MSLDATYILDYEVNGYISPTPMQIDKEFLQKEYGGHVEYINSYTLYYEKPKYRLDTEDIERLMADRILEKCDCELFKVIK